MLTFRKTIFMISEEQEVNYLECKVCQKEFLKFDQRGFRNAGFTAHQNRCIEKDYILNNPEPDRLQSPKQRLILPAPTGSSSSTSSSCIRLLGSSSTSSSPAPILQEDFQSYPQFPQPDQITEFNYSPLQSLNNQSNTFSIERNQPEMNMSIFPGYQYTANNSMTAVDTIFPITHCQYCRPEFGLHQPSCLLLAELLRQ
ncbi:hypothetical protein BDF21DRAFT_460557 [Thamnidium elegans]|uniref:Uncharacterized protein n=1 Tax=Thamnidium elegans TaxID=101142 RepID=A0A8H7SYY0_9FUNG|nr:hypothetical protein INT48_002724 [Thamnidium elegans]KAI8088413.1 hypothetical protein BDF21DRAFT_460557 [Thamnidium elegans]